MIAQRVAQLTGRPVLAASAVGGGMICRTYKVSMLDGTVLFAKAIDDPQPGFFHAEASGLNWLGEAGGPPLPKVVAVDDDILVITWIAPGRATPEGAEELGRALATLHARGAHEYGASWNGYIGTLPLDNTPAEEWSDFFVERRIRPYLKLAVDRGTLDEEGAAAVEEVCTRIDFLVGDFELPARIHGDLWSGNIHWGARGEGWLIDPAAHGGHRETDLAMLALFAPPHLERIIAAYDEVHPLAEGWRERVPLHQLHPLLVHAALFGTSYGAQAAAAARALAERLR